MAISTDYCVSALEDWSDWEVLSTGFRLNARVLKEILDGGQTFLWDLDADGIWSGVVGKFAIQLRLGVQHLVEFRVHRRIPVQEIRAMLVAWLRVDGEQDKLLEGLSVLEDAYLQKCMRSFPGLRVLQQPMEEVLLTFLCSSNKRIVQIKRMLQLICERFGTRCSYNRFCYPEWEQMAQPGLEDWMSCGTGYRARYIRESALRIADEPGFFASVRSCAYPEAKRKLMELPGVGDKVADCILLYGGGYFEAFPFDTWILKAMNKRYGLALSNRKVLHEFVHQRFGSSAGLAQQFIFAYEREVREL